MPRGSSLGILLCALCAGPILGQRPTPARIEGSDSTRLSLAEARALALDQNPSFRAALQEVAAARGDLVGASAYPFNPEVDAEGPLSLLNGSTERFEIRLSQEIELGGQRGLRIGAAAAGVRVAVGEVLDAARRLLAEVESAYYRLAASERRLVLAREIEALNRELQAAVRTQLGEGEVSLLQANLVEIEAARAQARVFAVDREAVGARLALGRLLGLEPAVVVATEEETSDEALPGVEVTGREALVAAAFEIRPDLAATHAQIDHSLELRRLASRELLPNLRVAAGTERDHPTQDARLGLALSFPIPLFDRNQGERARRQAEFEEATLRMRAVELQVRTEVLDALFAYESATQEVEILERGVLGAARQNQRLLDTAYTEGKLDLASVLLLRNQLLDAELGFLDAWERQRLAVVELRSATGAVLEDLTSLNGDLP